MQCSHYHTNDYKSRCTRKAVYWLLQPNGKRNPGGYVCVEHGNEITNEYLDKLGQEWRQEPIDDLGNYKEA